MAREEKNGLEGLGDQVEDMVEVQIMVVVEEALEDQVVVEL